MGRSKVISAAAKWETLWKVLPFDSAKAMDEANFLGAKGWQLVSLVPAMPWAPLPGQDVSEAVGYLAVFQRQAG